jgi:hypothetical protein
MLDDTELEDILSFESIPSTPYREETEASADLVDLVEAAELKGIILG